MNKEDLLNRVRECIAAANNLVNMAKDPDVEQGGIQYTKWMYRAAGMVDVIRVLGFCVEYDKESNQYSLA